VGGLMTTTISPSTWLARTVSRRRLTPASSPDSIRFIWRRRATLDGSGGRSEYGRM
jgi:hypothetical protein